MALLHDCEAVGQDRIGRLGEESVAPAARYNSPARGGRHDSWMQRRHEFFGTQGVQNILARKPSTPSHSDTVLKVAQAPGRVGVRRHDEFNAAPARLADPAWL